MSGERLQDHWSSGFKIIAQRKFCFRILNWLYSMSRVMRKSAFGVSNQARYKPDRMTTEDGQRLKIILTM